MAAGSLFSKKKRCLGVCDSLPLETSVKTSQVSVKISGKELLKPQKPEALPEVDGMGFPGWLFPVLGSSKANTFCNFQKGTGVNGGKCEPKNVIVKMPSSSFLAIQVSKRCQDSDLLHFFLGGFKYLNFLIWKNPGASSQPFRMRFLCWIRWPCFSARA